MITYKQNPQQLDFQAVLDLYESVGWISYTAKPKMLEEALKNSLVVLYAFDGDKLVGLIRAVGDGASILFIQDILVNPSYQRQGIGSQFVKKILARFSDVYQIHLLTDNQEGTRQYYQSLGFTEVTTIGCLAYTYLR